MSEIIQKILLPNDDLFDKTLNSLSENISDFNATVVGEKAQQYAVIINDNSGELIGGASIYGLSESIYVDLLWVSEKFRNCGYGSTLLKQAEDEGRLRGSKYSTVDTFSFQAEDFYKKNGYTEIGVINNYLFEHDRIFLRKKLEGL